MDIVALDIPFTQRLPEHQVVELMEEIIYRCKTTPLKPNNYVQCPHCYYEKKNGVYCETCDRGWSQDMRNANNKRKERVFTDGYYTPVLDMNKR